MARKRDYKKEYAASKAKAKAAGYKSQREYRKARKDLGLKGRGVSPLHKATKAKMYPVATPPQTLRKIRRLCQEWSDEHSQNDRSKYNPQWSDAKVLKYYIAFVVRPDQKLSRRKRKKQKLQWLHDYLVPDWMDEIEWQTNYT